MIKKNTKYVSLAIIFFIAESLAAIAQNDNKIVRINPNTESKEQKQNRMKWWTDARFGMFIHWGIYSAAARHEWVKNREKLTDSAYQKYYEAFNPDLYRPEEWAKKARQAGMKYMVITTKHHDGFCLWNTRFTDYKAPNTPAGKDLLKPMVDAFRAEGIRIGFYYSLLDWHHPDFPVDKNHPQRDDKNARALNASKNIKNYQLYMKNQLTELLTGYGKIDELFLDYSYPGEDGKGHAEWDAENLLKMIRKLQPGIIINDRLDLAQSSAWDYKTPEQFMPKSNPVVNGEKVPWETCQTFSGSWGYFRDEYSWKSPVQLIKMLVETVSKGGNLLLNVGPDARGAFDERATERLEAIGEWMKFNDRSVYGCTEAPAEFKRPDNCLLTYNAASKRLYVHVLEWPFKSLILEGYKGKVKYAQILKDGSEVAIKGMPKTVSHTTELADINDLILELPVTKPTIAIPVIELFLN